MWIAYEIGRVVLDTDEIGYILYIYGTGRVVTNGKDHPFKPENDGAFVSCTHYVFGFRHFDHFFSRFAIKILQKTDIRLKHYLPLDGIYKIILIDL